MTTVAPGVRFALEHVELKWLHQPLLYNVTLIHSEDSLHNWVHTSKLGTIPGEFVKYVSLLRSHVWPDILTVVVVVAVLPLLTVNVLWRTLATSSNMFLNDNGHMSNQGTYSTSTSGGFAGLW